MLNITLLLSCLKENWQDREESSRILDFHSLYSCDHHSILPSAFRIPFDWHAPWQGHQPAVKGRAHWKHHLEDSLQQKSTLFAAATCLTLSLCVAKHIRSSNNSILIDLLFLRYFPTIEHHVYTKPIPESARRANEPCGIISSTIGLCSFIGNVNLPPSTVDGTSMAPNVSTTLRKGESDNEKRKTYKATEMQRNSGVFIERPWAKWTSPRRNLSLFSQILRVVQWWVDADFRW